MLPLDSPCKITTVNRKPAVFEQLFENCGLISLDQLALISQLTYQRKVRSQKFRHIREWDRKCSRLICNTTALGEFHFSQLT